MEGKKGKRKLDESLLKRLRSSDDVVVLKALGELRSSGHYGYIPELLDILKHSESEIVHRELVRFLADIKGREAVPYIIEGLQNPVLKEVRSEIASACWQSGMDYSVHLDLFIHLFLESDYMTALESFSVIEQSLVYMNTTEIREKRSLVLEGLDKISEDKKPLVRELLNLMES